MQLKHTVPAELLYQNYWYRSGTNQTMRDALADIANTAERLVRLQEDDAVLDIGCNDGTLLGSYKTGGVYRIGFDPAKNLQALSRRIADTVVVGFFGLEAFRAEAELSKRQPKVVTSIAMFYDLEDPNKFVADVKAVMHPDGLWIIQMSYLPLMLKTNEIGNICHEHLEYYSLHALEYLLHLHGMEVVDAHVNEVNGGSIRAYIRRSGASLDAFADPIYRELASERVQELRDQETSLGLKDIAVYSDFGFRADRIKKDVVGFIQDQVRCGKRIYVYGASTKGNTLLQYYGLDHTLITAAAERNSDKWGKWTIGTHIPIVSEMDARADRPDFFLVLPWHFVDEFQARERDYLLSGGRFIMPMPYFALR